MYSINYTVLTLYVACSEAPQYCTVESPAKRPILYTNDMLLPRLYVNVGAKLYIILLAGRRGNYIVIQDR